MRDESHESLSRDIEQSNGMAIHRLMVYVATLILLVALGAYLYHPGDDVLVTIIATALGFLFGKASNGIRKGGNRDGSEDRGR